MNSKSFHLRVMYLSMRINPNNQFYGDVRVYYSLKYALLLDAVWCMTEALNKEEIGLSVQTKLIKVLGIKWVMYLETQSEDCCLLKT